MKTLLIKTITKTELLALTDVTKLFDLLEAMLVNQQIQ